MTDPARSDYDRGHLAGEINNRLADHDKHFKVINGSIVNAASQSRELGEQVAALALQVQRLADQAISRDATVIATASALEAADIARRRPLQRVAVVVTILVGLLALYAALRGWK